MKLRNGFVSNSSSSSFVIIGGSLSFDDIDMAYFGMTPEDNLNYDEFDDLGNRLTTFYTPLGMDVISSYESEDFLIGYNLEDTQFHDKTINQLLSEVRDLLKAVPRGIKPHSISLICGEIST